ncbi:MAG: DUF4129 domain-containing protein [Muribaculaceae bacterium]|nr:DUF4129 domain-containing protein [Muribaculaceae bacterium]
MAQQLTDTIAVSESLVREFTRQAAYDYNRELVNEETNYLERFFQWIEELFSRSYGATTEHTVQSWINVFCWIAAIVLLLGVAWWLYKSRVSLFGSSDDDDSLDYDVTLDNIHEIDFDARLAEARQRGNLREVCRLLYLQTLKRLADGALIDWRPFKTPSQYTRELPNEHLRALTNAFLRVRYGNFEATEALCRNMEQWQQQIVALIPTTNANEEKGGEPS